MFESTAEFALFDYFRVPYARVEDEPAATDLESLWVRGESVTLSWPCDAVLATKQQRPRSIFLRGIQLFGRIATDDEVRSWLTRRGGDWHIAEEVRDERGVLVGAVWRSDDGATVLPFDPSELIRNFWTERYLKDLRPAAVSHLAELARRSYYRARPLLPRPLQMRMRQLFSRTQSKSRFPRWPVETALHDFYDFLLEVVARLAKQPIPFIAMWPHDSTWALVLTHDVEAQIGYDRLPDLLRVEVENGYRSSWNFVPQNRYVVDDQLVETLKEKGFEVGVHGLYHDGRDLSSLANVKRRLPAIREYAERWQAKGFRSPATLRSADLMPMLGFDYDSSFSDTAPFEPQPGGCCTWLPYMIDDLVELPITLPQDHTLFEILGHRDERLWVEKACLLRDRGGMALLITHPDYIDNVDLLESYERFLQTFASDPSAWKALPHEVSSWWRQRSQSTVQEVDGEWRVVGAAEGEARVEFAAPQLQAV